MAKHNTYTISELAKYFDITPRAIRFYEDQHLLIPKRIKGKRIYNDRDFVRLKLILRGKRIGFTLSELKETLSLYDTQPNKQPQLQYVLKTIENHQKILLQRKEDIVTTLEDMDDVYARVKAQLKALNS